MDGIEGAMAISAARADLSEVVNVVRLQDRTVRLTRRGTPLAGIVPIDVLELIDALGGLDTARGVMRQALEISQMRDAEGDAGQER